MKTYLMNPATGSVDTLENWEAEVSADELESLIEVRLANGQEVPADFNPCNSSKYEWKEV
jgi:hypothetical protein